jgi:ubiquinone/menaquinone biosynthesis C-methylase UbiE
MAETDVDFQAITAAQQKMWSAGDFARIGRSLQIVSENLCEAAEVAPREDVLDVACGSGNTGIAAARRFATVTGLDYVPALLEHARERAKAELVEDAKWVVGDAQDLPFPDASFDVVMSTFGVMFAPDHQMSADELLRVTRRGGRIALGCWTPDGMIGEMFMTVAKHAPPPFKVDPPILWGTEDHLRELFGDGISDLRAERRQWMQRFPSPEYGLEYMRTWFGPTKMAFERLSGDEAAQKALSDDLVELSRRHNMAGDAAFVAPATYLEVVATRAG